MDLKRLQGFESLVPAQPNVGGLQKPSNGIARGPAGGNAPQGPSFKETLNEAMRPAETLKTNSIEGLKFSNHAVERMQTRGIRFTPEDMTRLNDAVSRAASKGSKDSLILMKDSALIVSVKNKTVVTVMDKTALKENVFTNIDSTIVM